MSQIFYSTLNIYMDQFPKSSMIYLFIFINALTYLFSTDYLIQTIKDCIIFSIKEVLVQKTHENDINYFIWNNFIFVLKRNANYLRFQTNLHKQTCAYLNEVWDFTVYLKLSEDKSINYCFLFNLYFRHYLD